MTESTFMEWGSRSRSSARRDPGGGAELFTNGVEWIGEGFGLSEGRRGQRARGPRWAPPCPETILPLVRIVSGHAGRRGHRDRRDPGGAPFMLTTLAMLVGRERRC
jgi:cation:H+ antiporter